MPKTVVYVLNSYPMNNLLEGLSLPELERKESGAPYFADNRHYISISHKDRYVVVAISDDHVGVDIELLKERTACFKLANAYFGEKIAKGDYTSFYTSWTKKEALGKYFEAGINKQILGTDTSKDSIEYDSEKLHFVTVQRKDIIISVCSKSSDVEFVWIDRTQKEKKKEKDSNRRNYERKRKTV